MSYREQLLVKFKERSAVIGVIGLGYVGLPLAVETAKAGYKVIGVEVDTGKIKKVNSGENYIGDVDDAELKQYTSSGKLHATADFMELKKADVVAITVPTPLNKTGDPDMSYIVDALEMMTDAIHAGMLVTLESTTYPGTTNEVVVPKLEATGLKIGESVFASFSPERVDPGNPTYHTQNTPKVVGGATPACCDVSVAFYETVIANIVRVNSATAAEMVKLYENTFRAINIGLVNELAIICDVLKVDVWEIVRAAATKPFGFMPFYPGPGLGGHCIPIDPSYLAWKLRSHNYRARFIELATEINSHMPEFVVDRILDLMNDEGRALKGSKILLLGMSYKREIDDVRESPSLDLIVLLRRKGAVVDYHDPYVPQIRDPGNETSTIKSVPLTKEAIAKYDLVLISTDHKSVDYQLVIDNSKLIFDSRDALNSFLPGKARIVKL